MRSRIAAKTVKFLAAASLILAVAMTIWAQEIGKAESPALRGGGPVGPSTWSLGEGERLYHHFCTPCHGYYGEGNGYNARFLEKKPADHTDPVSMSKRTDAKLFEIVRDGGAKSGLSNQMPPWGKAIWPGQAPPTRYSDYWHR